MTKVFFAVISILIFAASLHAEDDVVARVNSSVLTNKDLESQVDRVIVKTTFHRDVPIEKRKRFYDKAIEELIVRELQYQNGLENGLKPDKARVDAQVDKIKKRFNAEEYKASLEKAGMTEEMLRSQIEKEMVIQAIIAKKANEASPITETAIKDYYEQNISKYKQPETVKLRLISTKDEKKANDMLAKIKEGDDFGDIAHNMSEDDYRLQNGDIGYMHRGRLLPEIEDIAFNKMKVGELSDVIKADDKWFILKLEDKKPEHQLSFEETKDKLKKEMEAKQAQELNEKWIAGLKAKAKIEILLKTDSTDNAK
ncbi:MAG: peptidyl-prolyl cis-trans isomerase [Thermodesulfovibrionales bacterium]|jgi:parvulin-like peptidyl-prolyl isomerase